MKLNKPLGGVVMFASGTVAPIRKLMSLPPDEARAKCSYVGDDLRFFMWHGGADTDFPADHVFAQYD